jgi:signal transduction histidine kinase/phage shock protein PspC (stress-responsive transcriptional regulator)
VILDGVSTEPARDTASSRGTPSRPPLVRRTEGRLLAGVANGIAAHLGFNVMLVRVVFALLMVNGIGGLAYLALWILVPDEHDDGSGSTRLRSFREAVRTLARNRPGDVPHRRRKLVAYALVGMASASLLGAFGIGWHNGSGFPLTIALLGALLIWWRAPEAQRAQWTSDARWYGKRIRRSRLSRRGPLLVVLGGIGLVAIGVTSFLAANDALAQARAGALAISATIVGVLLVTGPWLFRLVRELTAERRERIREHERAEMAAHVHDSVLQTLALIQSQAADPDAVRRLARRQERELRTWLYTKPGTADDGPPTFATALRSAAAEVEDGHGVDVEVVVVGDAPLDDALTATVAAAREGMVNAAKSSGAPVVSVFAEVGPRGVEVFVRDRGRGFDPEEVPDDRRGIRDSIVGRMARHGGKGAVRSGPTGTEVALSVARKAES